MADVRGSTPLGSTAGERPEAAPTRGRFCVRSPHRVHNPTRDSPVWRLAPEIRAAYSQPPEGPAVLPTVLVIHALAYPRGRGWGGSARGGAPRRIRRRGALVHKVPPHPRSGGGAGRQAPVKDARRLRPGRGSTYATRPLLSPAVRPRGVVRHRVSRVRLVAGAVAVHRRQPRHARGAARARTPAVPTREVRGLLGELALRGQPRRLPGRDRAQMRAHRGLRGYRQDRHSHTVRGAPDAP